MVMSGLETDEHNQIYYLKYSKETGYAASLIETFGMDASAIIELTLNETPRAREVQEMLNNLFNLIDCDKVEEAQNLLEEMRERFGDNLPELAKAETMLNIISDR